MCTYYTTHHILAGAIAEPEGSSRSTGIYPGDSDRVRDGSARWERLMSLLHPRHSSWGILVGIFETSGLHSGPAPSFFFFVCVCLQHFPHFARVHFTRSGLHLRYFANDRTLFARLCFEPLSHFSTADVSFVGVFSKSKRRQKVGDLVERRSETVLGWTGEVATTM